MVFGLIYGRGGVEQPPPQIGLSLPHKNTVVFFNHYIVSTASIITEYKILHLRFLKSNVTNHILKGGFLAGSLKADIQLN